MHPESVYLLLLITLVATISSARGNYGYGQQFGNQICDKNVYNRAKEMIRLEMQQLQQRGGSGAPYDSNNNRYPPLTNSYQVNYTNNQNNRNSYLVDQLNEHQCKLLRQSFDDVLINTPLCDPIGSYQFQVSTDLIQQCRNMLQQHCERNQGWRYAQCFKRREILDCENQYNYLKQTPTVRSDPTGISGRQYNNNNPHPISYELCQAFETFRNCVMTHSRSQCYTSDLDHLGTYFVDKAHNAAWSCIPANHQYGTDVYSRRTDLSYQPGSNQPGSGYYPPPPYSQFQNIPNGIVGTISPRQFDGTVIGSSQSFPLDASIDRAGAGGALSGLHAGTVSVCIERVRPFETSCLDHLIMRQREARYGRSSTDVQRRICCALFRYRDCLSRVVLERCFDNSRVTVDILMGDRNREITQTCRDITRDQCNGSTSILLNHHQSTIWLMIITLATLSISWFSSF